MLCVCVPKIDPPLCSTILLSFYFTISQPTQQQNEKKEHHKIVTRINNSAPNAEYIKTKYNFIAHLILLVFFAAIIMRLATQLLALRSLSVRQRSAKGSSGCV